MWATRIALIRLGRQETLLRQRRSLHMVLKLPYENFQPEINGIYPIYSNTGFHVAWTERQASLIEQVNTIIQGIYIQIHMFI